MQASGGRHGSIRSEDGLPPCFLRFMADFARAAQGATAIDGKTLRRSFDQAAQKSPPGSVPVRPHP
jgi:hypothetical protein